jgi:hypothetical protein
MLYNSHLIKESNQRKSRQTRTLRAFCLASASLCATGITNGKPVLGWQLCKTLICSMFKIDLGFITPL